MPTWETLYSLLLALAVLNLVFVVACLAMLALGRYVTRRLIATPADPASTTFESWPSISLIAPARNEERHIEQAVRSLTRLDYPNLEITIINDRSTDRTSEILDRLAAEFPQLNVVHLTELPAGWLGKNHALQLGADRSHGEWLLFTDADIVYQPTTLRRAIVYAEKYKVDHLTAWPEIHAATWLLTAFMCTFAIYLFLFVRVWSIRNRNSRAHIGVGAFNLVRATVYRAVGGHERIRMRPDDDLKLGKIIKHAGYSQDLVDASGLLSLEMYRSVGELIRGLEKNAFSGADYSIPLTLVSSFLSLLFGVWPFLAVFIVSGPARWVYLAVCLSLWLMALGSARVMKAPAACALAYPVAVLLFAYIQWRTMLLNYYHGGIRWRDTHYSLKELRANKV
jgi:cellulose synthase/poly-beta-1,6-N-acetylglucosamine synthase-like glycosyltransferase